MPLHLKQLDISSFLLRPGDLQRILHPLPSTLEDLSLRVNTDSAEDSRATAAELQNAGPVTKLLLLCASGARNEEAVCCLGTALSGLSTLQDLCCPSVEYTYRSSWQRYAERSSEQKRHLQVQQPAMPCHLTRLVRGGIQDSCQRLYSTIQDLAWAEKVFVGSFARGVKGLSNLQIAEVALGHAYSPDVLLLLSQQLRMRTLLLKVQKLGMSTLLLQDASSTTGFDLPRQGSKLSM